MNAFCGSSGPKRRFFKNMKARIALLAAASLVCASVWAGPPQPKLYAGQMKAAYPLRACAVRMENGKVRQVGPWVALAQNPWANIKGEGTLAVGPLNYDAYEGDVTGAPTDGMYNENFSLTGSRWYLGETWVNTNEARYIERLFPGRNGMDALGLDLVFYLNDTGSSTNKLRYVLEFTFEDNLDLNNFVPPTTVYDGVALDFGDGTITPGGWYSNVDLTGSGLSFRMPDDGMGGHIQMFASDFDGTNLTFSEAAQPMLWGTKPENPSKMSAISWMDGPGDGSQRDGVYETAYDWTFAYHVAPVSYSVTDGTETSAHNVNLISAQDATYAVIRGKNNPAIAGRPQAAIEVNLTVPDDATLGWALFTDTRLFRSKVVMKSNGKPVGSNDFRWRVSVWNRSTSAWEVRFTGTPQSTPTEVVTSSILFANLANYIDPVTRNTRVRVEMFNPKPLFFGWTLDIDWVTTPVSSSGPDPLGPGTGFSGP